MLIVLSPAKALDFTLGPAGAALSQPRLLDQTAELAKTTRRLKAADLKRMMALSDSLAILNRERFQAFDPESDDGLQAAFAFNGEVYLGLKARELAPKDLAWAQDRVRILSGLYGLLRPLDAIQPYRLEMGVRIKTRRGASLYDFWGARIAEALDADLADHKDKVIVNCASTEYFSAVDRTALKASVVSCRFLEEKDGEARVIAFYAKRARGQMARYAIEGRIERAEDLRGFDVAGYRYAADLSSEAEYVFRRPQPPPITGKRPTPTRKEA